MRCYSLFKKISLIAFFFYFDKNSNPIQMREVIYPKKLDVPCTQGNMYDLLDFFCGRSHTRSIARNALKRCKRLSYN